MKEKEIRSSIKTVYGMLWDVLALYEKTECYNKVPEGEKEADNIANIGKIIIKIDTIKNILFAHSSILSLLVILFL